MEDGWRRAFAAHLFFLWFERIVFEMTTKIDVKALAELARLEVSDDELARLEKEIPGILSFVEEIQKAAGEVPVSSPELRNVMREDKDPHESGMHTEVLLSAAPAQEGNRIVVKQVISKKR